MRPKQKRKWKSFCLLLSYVLCCFQSLFVKGKVIWRGFGQYDSMVLMKDCSKECQETCANGTVSPDVWCSSKCQAPREQRLEGTWEGRARNWKHICVDQFCDFVVFCWASAYLWFILFYTLEVDGWCNSLSHGTVYSCPFKKPLQSDTDFSILVT